MRTDWKKSAARNSCCQNSNFLVAKICLETIINAKFNQNWSKIASETRFSKFWFFHPFSIIWGEMIQFDLRIFFTLSHGWDKNPPGNPRYLGIWTPAKDDAVSVIEFEPRRRSVRDAQVVIRDFTTLWKGFRYPQLLIMKGFLDTLSSLSWRDPSFSSSFLLGLFAWSRRWEWNQTAVVYDPRHQVWHLWVEDRWFLRSPGLTTGVYTTGTTGWVKSAGVPF